MQEKNKKIGREISIFYFTFSKHSFVVTKKTINKIRKCYNATNLFRMFIK